MSQTAGETRVDRRVNGRTATYGRHDRYWIPLDYPQAVRFYTECLFVPRSRQDLFWGAMARAVPAASTRALRIRNGPETTGPVLAVASPDLMSVIEQSLSRLRRCSGAPLWALILEPYQRSGRGQNILFLFEGASPRPCALAKVTQVAGGQVQLQREHEALTGLQVRLGQAMRSTVPAPLAFISAKALTVMLETVLPGRSMYRDLRNSWWPRRLVARHLHLAQDWLIRFQQSTVIGDGPADESIIREHITAPLEAFRQLTPLSMHEQQMIDQALETARRLRGERLPVVAQQGDFWARNLVVQNGRVGVVDWARFHPRQAPFADLFMFATSYGLSYPWRWGCWADPVAAFRATYLSRSWLARSVHDWVHTYCRRMRVSSAWLDVFFPVFLAQQVCQAQPSALDDDRNSGQQLWRQLIGEYAQQGGSVCFG